MNAAPTIIAVYGPTASGKTALSIRLAERFSGEVVSADSRQIFRGMDIGTGKVTREEMGGVPHHCLDLADPDEDFSVGLFVKAADAAIAEIRARGKVAVVCGGTGLYLDALLFDFDVPEIPPDWEYRAELERYRLENGNVALWEKLREADPSYAAELHPNNFRYVVRGLEVIEKTGRSKKDFRTERKLRYPGTVFATPFAGDREALYARIDARVGGMFADGLVEEASGLVGRYGGNAFGLETIGYAEVAAYLAGEFGNPEGLGSPAYAACIEAVRKNSRNYAKRQITWNKRYFGESHLTGAEGGL